MDRRVLTDGSGKWFDYSKAERFEEETHWNGNNHISNATGSQWDHECLFRTAGGRWILLSWSQWQGSTDSYVEIDDAAAARWLSINEHEPPAVVSDEFAALEIK